MSLYTSQLRLNDYRLNCVTFVMKKAGGCTADLHKRNQIQCSSRTAGKASQQANWK